MSIEHLSKRTKDSIVLLMIYSKSRSRGAVAHSDWSREQRVFPKGFSVKEREG